MSQRLLPVQDKGPPASIGPVPLDPPPRGNPPWELPKMLFLFLVHKRVFPTQGSHP